MTLKERGKGAGQGQKSRNLEQRLHNLEIEMEAVEHRLKATFFQVEREVLEKLLFDLKRKHKKLMETI